MSLSRSTSSFLTRHTTTHHPTVSSLISTLCLDDSHRLLELGALDPKQYSNTMTPLRSHLLSFTRAPSSPLAISSRHAFHISAPHSSSPLFHLAALSNSRESRYLKRTSKLSQVEHSPNLQLIRSSEVEPFGGVRSIPGEAEGLPVGKRTITTPATSAASTSTTSTPSSTSTEQRYRTESPTERASRLRKIEEVATQEINPFPASSACCAPRPAANRSSRGHRG
jgi:hypothetical protein